MLPVDKQAGLPPDYGPPDLVAYPRANKPLQVRQRIVADLDGLLDACAAAVGEAPLVVSAYRCYADQATLFQSYVQDELAAGHPAQEADRRANTYSARPGHSEHQLGTTVDLSVSELGYRLKASFGSTAAGGWLLSAAHRFGFAYSYPAGKERLTGYVYEPWHLRWVGRDLAARVHAAGYLDPASPLTLSRWLASLTEVNLSLR